MITAQLSNVLLEDRIEYRKGILSLNLNLPQQKLLMWERLVSQVQKNQNPTICQQRKIPARLHGQVKFLQNVARLHMS